MCIRDRFECTAINIGTLSEDDAPVTYHFKYCNVSKKTVRISKSVSYTHLKEYDENIIADIKQEGVAGDLISLVKESGEPILDLSLIHI